MSQHDFNIANQGFPATRADINNAFQAIASNSAGPTAPSTTFANQWWYDTTNDKMYLRNAANSAWIEVAVVDQTNNEWEITTGVIQAKDADGFVIKTDDGIARLTMADDGDVTFANDVTITGSVSASNIPSAGPFSNRSKIINGAMALDQRNGGSSVTPTDGQYILDRWRAGVSAASKFSVQQSSVAPAGFGFSMLCTSLSAYSVTTNDNFEMMQFIEGFNAVDLSWGTASAQSVTLSFWARSSLTGTFGGALNNSAFNRSYPFSYTISTANTWEYKTVTIDGDTSGTWIGATNGIGAVVGFCLGAGSGRSGTADAWAASTLYSATGATSVVGTSGATLYITGVQLEVGDTATPFEHRSYGDELARCQRYYYQTDGGGGVVAATHMVGFIAYNATTVGHGFTSFPVVMRARPTTVVDTTNLRLWGPNLTTVTGVSSNNNTTTTGSLNLTGTGFTVKDVHNLISPSNGLGYVSFDAEL